ncbi:MAG: ATP-binding protein [Burkholderiales bacterium]
MTSNIWLVTTVLLLPALSGMVVLYVKQKNVLRDSTLKLENEIARHKRVAEKLEVTEYRLKTIIESEPECVKLQAADGTVLEMNPAGLALVDADRPEDMIGKSVYQMIAPEHCASYEAFTRSIFAGKSGSIEFQLVSLKGRSRWMESHAVPLRDAKGEIVALLAVTRDITDRKQADEETRRHQAELAHVMRLTTMGEMATGIAHELNQPLTAIANYTQGCIRRLCSGSDTAELLDAMRHVASQAERAGEIIRRIKNFVRKKEPNVTVVDVNAAIREVCALAQPECREHGITVRLELAEPLLPTKADKIEIQQVILNLARNGVEAMSGSCSEAMELSLSTRMVDGGMIEVAVRDSGPGIPEENLGQVFNQFFTTKPNGMGIGLSISRSIVESHRGRLWVDRNNAQGATLRFTLPAVTDS